MNPTEDGGGITNASMARLTNVVVPMNDWTAATTNTADESLARVMIVARERERIVM